MSEENKVEVMSNEELNAALVSDLNQLDGKGEAKPEVQSETKSESKPEPEEEEAKADDTSKGVEGEDEEAVNDEQGNPYRKRIDRLLRKRDTLQDQLAEKDRLINELKNGKVDEEVDEPLTTSKLLKVLDERDSKSKNEVSHLKANDAEFDALVKKVPNASKRKQEILELAEKLPTLSFEAIDRIISPADHVDPIEANRKNARRMETSSRSRADLAKEKDMSKASTSEMKKYLLEEQAKGNLNI